MHVEFGGLGAYVESMWTHLSYITAGRDRDQTIKNHYQNRHGAVALACAAVRVHCR